MTEPKTIYCPKCGRAVCHYDGKQTIKPVGKCKKCNKLVIYDIQTKETKLKPMPSRRASSGMVFY